MKLHLLVSALLASAVGVGAEDVTDEVGLKKNMKNIAIIGM